MPKSNDDQGALFDNPKCPRCGMSGTGHHFWCPNKDAPGKARNDARDTSAAAAALIEPRSGTLRRMVLDAVVANPRGSTDEEMQLMLGMNPSTQRPRRVELVEGGWIEDSLMRRPTKSRTRAVVWVVTDQGRARLGAL